MRLLARQQLLVHSKAVQEWRNDRNETEAVEVSSCILQSSEVLSLPPVPALP